MCVCRLSEEVAQYFEAAIPDETWVYKKALEIHREQLAALPA